MKTFTDNAGRTWTVAVNVDAIKRVKTLLTVNLLEIVEGGKPDSLLERLIGDPVLLCDVLYVLCKPEADAKGVSDADFGKAMAGDAIDAATTAMLEELADFFPMGRRNLLKKALAKIRSLEAMVIDRAAEKLDDPKLEAELLATIAGGPAGGSQGSPVSAPAP